MKTLDFSEVLSHNQKISAVLIELLVKRTNVQCNQTKTHIQNDKSLQKITNFLFLFPGIWTQYIILLRPHRKLCNCKLHIMLRSKTDYPCFVSCSNREDQKGDRKPRTCNRRVNRFFTVNDQGICNISNLNIHLFDMAFYTHWNKIHLFTK